MVSQFISWVRARFSPSDFNSSTLEEHFAATYFWLRLLMGVIGVAIPVVLWAINGGREPNWSVSGYYHSDVALSRNFLVGSLISVGVCLIMYRGYTYGENLLLNLAGFAVMGVALLPCGEWQSPRYSDRSFETWKEMGSDKIERAEIDSSQQTIELKGRTIWSAVLVKNESGAVNGIEYDLRQTHPLHLPIAVVFFLAIWGAMFFYAKVTTEKLPDGKKKQWYRRFYSLYPWVSLAVVIVVTVATLLLKQPYYVFVVEWLGVWAFGFYWLIKTFELKDGSIDKEHFAEQAARCSCPPSNGAP